MSGIEFVQGELQKGFLGESTGEIEDCCLRMNVISEVTTTASQKNSRPDPVLQPDLVKGFNDALLITDICRDAERLAAAGVDLFD